MDPLNLRVCTVYKIGLLFPFLSQFRIIHFLMHAIMVSLPWPACTHAILMSLPRCALLVVCPCGLWVSVEDSSLKVPCVKMEVSQDGMLSGTRLVFSKWTWQVRDVAACSITYMVVTSTILNSSDHWICSLAYVCYKNSIYLNSLHCE